MFDSLLSASTPLRPTSGARLTNHFGIPPTRAQQVRESISGNANPVKTQTNVLGGAWRPEQKGWMAPAGKVSQATTLVPNLPTSPPIQMEQIQQIPAVRRYRDEDKQLGSSEIVVQTDGTTEYYNCGVLHRNDGPAVIEVYADYDGPERHRSWYDNGVLHRNDGPAVIGGRTVNGEYEWWRTGVRHRNNGPAVIRLFEREEYCGPVYEWWLNGILQRRQTGNGIIYYYKNDSLVLIELPDGRRIITRDGAQRYEDTDGNDLGEAPSPDDLENTYDGYLKANECSHFLYNEPETTFHTYNPIGRAEFFKRPFSTLRK